MIKQKSVTVKTGAATLDYSEMGEIVVNSASAVTITLPTPVNGLWYRVTNAGTGTVTVSYSGTLAELDEGQQVLLMANGASGYWLSQGGGGGASSLLELEDGPGTYVDAAGHIITVNDTEDGFEFTEVQEIEQYEVIANGDPSDPQVLFDENGDIVLGPTGRTAGIAITSGVSESEVLTTKGDLLVYNGSAYVRLPVGSNDQVLIADSAEELGVKWATPSAGGGGNLSVDLAESTSTEGQNQSRATGGSFTALTYYLTVLKPIKITKFLIDIKKAATYTLSYLGEPIADAVVVSSDDQTEVEFTLTSPLVLLPGLYAFKLTSSASVVWYDSSATNFYGDFFELTNETKYDGTSYNYRPCLKLVAYVGTLSIL